jgi:hypothetical protein
VFQFFLFDRATRGSSLVELPGQLAELAGGDAVDRGKIIGSFKSRPERDGYEVVVGRKILLAKKKEIGAKFFLRWALTA